MGFNKMRIIAGPCQHETYEQSIAIAEHCKHVCDKYDICLLYTSDAADE